MLGDKPDNVYGERTPEMDRGTYQIQADSLERTVADLKLCLAGNPASKRWQELNVELTNKETQLLFMKRRLAHRTPQMESWADPLPG